jgi:hypothetical protein
MTYFLIILCASVLVSNYFLRARVKGLEQRLGAVEDDHDQPASPTPSDGGVHYTLETQTRPVPTFTDIPTTNGILDTSGGFDWFQGLVQDRRVAVLGGVVVVFGILSALSFAATQSLFSFSFLMKCAASALVLVTIGLTYYLFKKGFPSRLVMYTLGSFGLSVILGAGIVFSGPVLVITYAVLCLVTFLAAIHFGLPERFVQIVALSYVVPGVASLQIYGSAVAGEALSFGDRSALLLVWVMCTVSALWLIHRPGAGVYASGTLLVFALGGAGYMYGYGAIAIVADQLFVWPDAFVMMHLAWSLMSLCALFYVVKSELPGRIVEWVAWSFLVPLFASLAAMIIFATLATHGHYTNVGAWLQCGVAGLVILLLAQEYCRELQLRLRRTIGGLLIAFVVAVVTTTYLTWVQAFDPMIATVGAYMSYAMFGYFLTAILLLVRAPAWWIVFSSLLMLLPIGMALLSIETHSSWSSYLFSLLMTGLTTIVIFVSALARRIARHHHTINDALVRRLIEAIGVLYGVVAFIFGLLILWKVAHQILSVSYVSLFVLCIYAIIGFFLCWYGRQNQKIFFVYVGGAVVAFTVIRILAVEMLYLDSSLRIITICIGSILLVGGVRLTQKLSRPTRSRFINDV